MNDVTFLIPVFNLKENRLLNFKYVLKKIRDCKMATVVVEQLWDNTTKSNISDLCKEMGARYEPVYIKSNEIHKSTLINRGTNIINTEYVWMNDADCVLNFAAILEESFKHDFIQPYRFAKKIDSVTSTKLLAGEEVAIPFFSNKSQLSNKEYIASYISLPMALSFIYKKEAFLSLGGMCESFKGWGFEDNEFSTRLFKSNHTFTFIDLNGIHLWHEEAKFSEGSILNKLIWESKHSKDDIECAVEKHSSIIMNKSCNILTLFRGNFEFLQNVDSFLWDNVPQDNVSITWVINTLNEDFITAAQNKSKKYKDIRLIVNREQIKLTNHYFDYRHEYITNIYSNVLNSITTDYICTFEDDMIPPDGSFVKLFNKIQENKNIGAVAAIYNSKDEPTKACCFVKNANAKVETESLKNNGYIPASRTGGGFTIWKFEAIKKILPITFRRINENYVVGWDWYCSENIEKLGYQLILDTDLVCQHLD